LIWQVDITYSFTIRQEKLRKSRKLPLLPTPPVVPKVCDTRELQPVPRGFVDTFL
jgi:hypothetical protein